MSDLIRLHMRRNEQVMVLWFRSPAEAKQAQVRSHGWHVMYVTAFTVPDALDPGVLVHALNGDIDALGLKEVR